MLEYSVPTALTGAAFGSAVLAALFFYLSRLGGSHRALGWWCGALTFTSARYLLLLEGSLSPGGSSTLMVAGAVYLADVALIGMIGCLIAGSFVFVRHRYRVEPVMDYGPAGASPVALKDASKHAPQSEGRVARQTALLQALVDNLPIGVSLVDRNLNAVAFNQQFLDLLEFPQDRFAVGDPFEKFIRFNAERGEYGDGDVDKLVHDRVALAANPRAHCFERVRPDGDTIEISGTPLPGGGFVTTYIDVTERKAAAARLAASEARFRDFAESASDWLWEQDADLRFTFVSHGGLEPFGLNAADFIGKSRQETGLEPSDGGDWQAHQADLAARRPFRDFKVAHRGFSDKTFWVTLSGWPIFDAKGVFKGYRGTGRDITAGVEAEERLGLAQRRLSAAVANLTDGIAIFDCDDRLVLCNEAFRQSVRPIDHLCVPGVTFEELLRQSVAHGRFAEIDVNPEEFIARRLAQHKDVHSNYERRLANGSWLLVREQRLPDGGSALVVTDITGVKRREAELGRKSELLQATLENMGEGIGVYDRNMRLIAWNDRLVELLEPPDGLVHVGMSFEALLRYQAESVEPGDDEVKEVIRQLVDSARAADGSRHGSWRRNGRHIELRCNPMPEGGFVTLYSDTTERVRAEIALRDAKESAELANRTKTEFLANMSHELRTPLNAIIGFSELIHRQTFGPLGSDRYGEYAQDILDSGRHLLKLINDILDVSKMEAGKVELDESEVRIEQVIRSSARLVSGRAQEAKVRLSLPRSPNLPPLRADERRLKQVLLNLLSNAIKFTPPGGQVSVEANPSNRSGFTIKVSDTGIGIHPADIAKVLSPFGQVDSNLSRRYDGTGLGLPLSKALVELHGGRLSIDSKVGVGTTVTVTLPAERIIRH